MATLNASDSCAWRSLRGAQAAWAKRRRGAACVPFPPAPDVVAVDPHHSHSQLLLLVKEKSVFRVLF